MNLEINDSINEGYSEKTLISYFHRELISMVKE